MASPPRAAMAERGMVWSTTDDRDVGRGEQSTNSTAMIAAMIAMAVARRPRFPTRRA